MEREERERQLIMGVSGFDGVDERQNAGQARLEACKYPNQTITANNVVAFAPKARLVVAA